MSKEHPDLTMPAAGSADLAEMSEVARLQADVLPMGLVREARPVFVYDAALAKAKSSNAARQARHREKLAQKGIVKSDVPTEIAESVKKAGSWDAWISEQKTIKIQEKIVEVPIEVIKELRVEVPVEVIKEVPSKLNSEQKSAYELGKKAAKLTGWRRSLLLMILR